MKTILVTGATRGVGRAIAQGLVASGYRVIGTGRSAVRPADWPDDPHLVYRAFDLAESGRHYEFVRKLREEYGSLYGLVNNAGLGIGGVLGTMHDSEIERLVSVNLLGTMVLTKYVVRGMMLEGEGRIVTMASVVASSGFKGLSVYAATKGGLVSFTKSLARELGGVGITVNCVSPGFLETEMTASVDEEALERIRRRSPLGELVTPTDVAGAVRFLMSEEARRMTGLEWVVDAGASI